MQRLVAKAHGQEKHGSATSNMEHETTEDAIADIRFNFRGPSQIRHDRRLQVLELSEISLQEQGCVEAT